MDIVQLNPVHFISAHCVCLAFKLALGRVGLPDDIGDLISALVSDDCRWVNAQRIEAFGGMFI